VFYYNQYIYIYVRVYVRVFVYLCVYTKFTFFSMNKKMSLEIDIIIKL
jgi:hypothetical protein